LAREAGYDSIVGDPDEVIALSNTAITPEAAKPTEAKPTRKALPSNVLMLTEIQKLLDQKAFISETGKIRPGARRLAQIATGKNDIRRMTEDELAKFGQYLKRLPEPSYNNKGQRIPPSIPKTTALTKPGEFETKYKEPTVFRLTTPQEYYAEKLGVASLVRPAEAGKIRHSLEYQKLSNEVDKQIAMINALGKTTIREKAAAKLANRPTKAVARFGQLLDQHESAPESLTPQEKRVFDWFRNLTRLTIQRENEVRAKLDLQPIRYRKGYMRHVAKGLTKDILDGRYPFPQGRKYFAEELQAATQFD